MDIRMVRGSSLTLELTVITDSESGFTPVSGDVFRFGVKRCYTDSSFVLSKTYQGSSYSTTTDSLSIAIAPSDTASLEVGEYVYDIGLQRGNNYYPIITQSRFILEPNITKWTSV